MVILVALAVGSILAMFILLTPSPARLEHGIYVWTGSQFTKIDTDPGKPYVPKEDGYYVYYFHNNDCPHCQRFYPKWVQYLSQNSHSFKDVKFVEVVCDWFTDRCNDPSAKKTFEYFQVTSSPAVLIIEVRDGQVQIVSDVIQDYQNLVRMGYIKFTGEIEADVVGSIISNRISEHIKQKTG